MISTKKSEKLSAKPNFSGVGDARFDDFETLVRNAANYPDLLSILVHRLAAERLCADPELIEIAKNNLKNWLRQNPAVGAWLEWKRILETESFENILKIMTADTDEGQRLRSSSPFAGLINAEERRNIIKICAETKPF